MYSCYHDDHTFQSDIELRLGQERLRSVHSLLGEAVSSHPEANQATIIYCQHANIPPPDIHTLMRRESYGSRYIDNS